MTESYPSRFSFRRSARWLAATPDWPAAVTTFPSHAAGVAAAEPGPFTISSDRRYGLVDVAAHGMVFMEGGEVELLDASGESEVTLVGGTVHFLESSADSTVKIFGGDIEFLTVMDRGVVKVFGTQLQITGRRLTGVLADGTPISAGLNRSDRRSIDLLPPPRFGFGPVADRPARWDGLDACFSRSRRVG